MVLALLVFVFRFGLFCSVLVIFFIKFRYYTSALLSLIIIQYFIVCIFLICLRRFSFQERFSISFSLRRDYTYNRTECCFRFLSTFVLFCFVSFLSFGHLKRYCLKQEVRKNILQNRIENLFFLLPLGRIIFTVVKVSDFLNFNNPFKT